MHWKSKTVTTAFIKFYLKCCVCMCRPPYNRSWVKLCLKRLGIGKIIYCPWFIWNKSWWQRFCRTTNKFIISLALTNIDRCSADYMNIIQLYQEFSFCPHGNRILIQICYIYHTQIHFNWAVLCKKGVLCVCVECRPRLACAFHTC